MQVQYVLQGQLSQILCQLVVRGLAFRGTSMSVSMSEIEIDSFNGFEIIVYQGALQGLYDCLVLQGISHSHSREYGVNDAQLTGQ